MKRILLIASLLALPLLVWAQPPEATTARDMVAASHASAATTASTETGTSTEPSAAEAPAPAPTDESASTAQPADQAEDPSIGSLVGDAGKVVSDWRTLGTLAGLIALINLLVNLLRFRALAEWFDADEKRKRVKPFIAAGLGALLTGLSSFATGAGVLQSILAGAMAGFAAVGAHEAFKRKKAKEAEGTG